MKLALLMIALLISGVNHKLYAASFADDMLQKPSSASDLDQSQTSGTGTSNVQAPAVQAPAVQTPLKTPPAFSGPAPSNGAFISNNQQTFTLPSNALAIIRATMPKNLSQIKFNPDSSGNAAGLINLIMPGVINDLSASGDQTTLLIAQASERPVRLYAVKLINKRFCTSDDICPIYVFAPVDSTWQPVMQVQSKELYTDQTQDPANLSIWTDLGTKWTWNGKNFMPSTNPSPKK